MHQMRISTNKVSSVMLRPKMLKILINCENCKRAGKPHQIACHEIEPNPSKDRFMHEEDNPSFWCIWCIKISIVLVLHFNPWVEASASGL
jgi:hypothetical protein